VVLYDPRTMMPVKVLSPAAERVYRVAFSPDSKQLAAATWADEDSALVWDVETGKQTLRLKHRGHCWSIQFSPDGNRLLTVGADRTPILWDAKSGEELHRFSPHDQLVWPVATFTADGRQIVTCARGVVKIWDAKSWSEVATLPGPEQPDADLPEGRHLSLAVSANGAWLAAGAESGFKIWAMADWKEQAHAATPATWLAFAPDSRTLLTGPHECPEEQWHAVTRWDTRTGQRLRSATLGSRGTWAVYHLSIDGRTLFGMACDPAEPAIHVYDAETGAERYLPGHAGRVGAVAVSPDGVWIASAGADGTVRVWDVATSCLLHTLSRPGRTAGPVIFAPDGKTLYAAWQEDGVIRAIDPATGQWRELAAYGPRLRGLAVAPDGALLAAAGEGGVCLWALPDATPRGAVTGVPFSPAAIAFSPDARTLAVGGAESIRLFEAATGRSVRMLEFPGAVRWVEYRPDGRSLAAAGEAPGNPVLVFDLAPGGRTVRLKGSESPNRSGTWRADGGLLATVGTAEGAARLWDFRSATPRRGIVTMFEPNTQGVEAAAFAPEGRHLVLAHTDGTIAVLRLAKMGEVFRLP
jgi:WD40 repeat protein